MQKDEIDTSTATRFYHLLMGKGVTDVIPSLITSSAHIFGILLVSSSCVSCAVTLVTGVKEIMDNQSIVLPKMNVNNYESVWRQILALANHYSWADERVLTFVPTLLDDFLSDAYETLSTKQRSTIMLLKENLGKVSGAIGFGRESWAQLFMDRSQHENEPVQTYAVELKKLFLKAFPNEKLSSEILLERFISGLESETKKFMLKVGKPTNIEDAITNACRIFNETKHERLEVNTGCCGDKLVL